MRCLMKYWFYLWLVCYQIAVPAAAEPYHLIAGSSALGFLENEKQNVNLGFRSVFNEVLASENIKCDFKNFDNSDELASAIKNNQANAFFGSPLEFLKSEAYLRTTPIASSVFSNQLKLRILLVVRKDSGIDSLQQLKNKKLTTQKWLELDMGGLYLETLLLENKLPVTKNFFSEIQNTDTSNRALVDLFFKKTDATLINENQFDIAAELNPQLRMQTKILMASEPYLIFLAAMSKNTPEEEVGGIKKSLFSMHKTAKGRGVLNLMKIQKFQEISLNELDNVRALVAKNEKLKAQNNGH